MSPLGKLRSQRLRMDGVGNIDNQIPGFSLGLDDLSPVGATTSLTVGRVRGVPAGTRRLSFLASEPVAPSPAIE